VCGVNYNDNCVDVTVTNVNGRTKVSLEPDTAFVKITNEVVPIRKGRGAVSAIRNTAPNTIVLQGRCRKQQGPFSMAIERPAAFFAFLLAERLRKEGIEVKGKIVERAVGPSEELSILASYKTPISDCLARSNKNSLGLAAEALFKTIGAYAAGGGKKGGWNSGRELISKYLLSIGVDNEQFHIDDGSGLSRSNMLSADAITAVLLDVYNGPNRQCYIQSLAIGGREGTISKYFKEAKYKGRVFGKTGYIRSVKSFSGYACTEHGDYVFSILTEKANGKTRGAINDIVEAVIDEKGT
jgi:D-alanyl-D-alanine carboxypeptidase/D-alanyl-D-alanine-endopeptidase (penicillin-binding protein 4)